MYEQIEKPKENKNKAIANSAAQKKSNVKRGFGFVDNWPETIAQSKLQEMTNNCPQAMRIAQLQVASDNYTQQNTVETFEQATPVQRVITVKSPRRNTFQNKRQLKGFMNRLGYRSSFFNTVASSVWDENDGYTMQTMDGFKQSIKGEFDRTRDAQSERSHNYSSVDGHVHNGDIINTAELPERKHDAETGILQQAYNEYNRQYPIRAANLFMKISTGPCPSCKSMINTFKNETDIPVIVEYTQTANTRKVWSVTRGEYQTYGHGGARKNGEGKWLKRFHSEGGKAPSAKEVEGWSFKNLVSLYERIWGTQKPFDTEDSTIEGLEIRSCNAKIQSQVKKWLKEYNEYLKSETLTSDEDSTLDSVDDATASSNRVKANAKFVYKWDYIKE